MNEKYNEEIDKINSMSIDDLFDIKSVNMRPMIDKFGGSNRIIYINKEFRKGNNKNSEVEAIYMLNNKVYLQMHVKNPYSDAIFNELFDRFFVKGKYISNNNIIDAKVIYTIDEKAEVLKSILKQFAWFNYSIQSKKNEIIKKISNYSIVNPVFDYFYQKHNIGGLKIDRYSTKDDVATHEGYQLAKKKLFEFINEKWFDLKDKNKEELGNIYKSQFANNMIDFYQTFNFEEWRKKKYYI